MASCNVWRLPEGLEEDIVQFAAAVERFQAGALTPELFRPQRVSRGIYEQRRDGTYMLRVRLPGGVLTAAQARVLAGLGRRYGGGTLHVTTRQAIQLHGVALDDTPAIMRGLLGAGLTCKGGGGDTVRNVAACPYAGVCPCERFDVTPLALAVTAYLVAQPGSYGLPRKYKIAFSGCPADCALASVADLGFVAHVREGRPVFAVYAGGGMGAESRVADLIEADVPAGDCIRVAEAVRRIFDREGNRTNRRRARLRFAVARLGVGAFAEIYRRERAAVEADGVQVCSAALTVLAPLRKLRGLDKAFVLRDGLRVLPQRQEGLAAIPLHLPLGQIGWADLERLADVTERWSGERALRTVASQKLVLRDVPLGALPELRDALTRLPADWTSRGALPSIMACTGASVCRLGLCRADAAALACAAALDAAQLPAAATDGLDVRISGCTNACGQHPVGAIGLCGAVMRGDSGLVPGYRVLLGARRGEGETRFGTGVGLVPARALPGLLVALRREFAASRQEGETFEVWQERLGLDHFRELVARHAVIPPARAEPEYYRDWGCGEEDWKTG